MDTERLLLVALIGFLGQIIDGALGMAYGVTCSTALISLGIPPAVASEAAFGRLKSLRGMKRWPSPFMSP